MHAISLANLLLFLKRSAPPLQKLLLVDGFNPIQDVDRLIECFRLVPALTHLDLGWWPTFRVEDILAALAESPPHVLSNLGSLIIRLYRDSTFSESSWETLLRALSVRRTQIRVVHVETLEFTKPAADIFAAFKDLAAGGMDIFVGSGEHNLLSL
ncbi:hypothetical protein B0H11DRAFT_2062361 [Mycena galericulata]|nr:hypothetical protein B0H11DRAFT_2062361 [Mycena galericulata]